MERFTKGEVIALLAAIAVTLAVQPELVSPDLGKARAKLENELKQLR